MRGFGKKVGGRRRDDQQLGLFRQFNVRAERMIGVIEDVHEHAAAGKTLETSRCQ